MQGSQSGQSARLGRHNAYGQDFALVLENQRPQIFRFLLASSRDVDVAEALTQECLLRALRSWSSFRGDSSVTTWLMRIAINLQRDHWRNRRLRFWRQVHRNSVDLGEISDYVPGTESSPEESVIAQDQVRQIWSVVNRINEPQRTVFLLRYVEDFSLSEIAHVTGLSKGTVKTHISRTLIKVRAALRVGNRAHLKR